MIETKYTVAKFETPFIIRDPEPMAKKQYDIDISTFTRSLQLENFTITDVTRHLLDIHDKQFNNKKNANQFVYRHFKKLEKEGVISGHLVEGGKAIFYRWSSQFDDVKTEQIQASSQTLYSTHHTIVKKLQEKIRLYKTEMLTNVGETEAYSEWLEEMPELEEDVKPHYQNTRDQAKLMLGKVKGFERLLAEYEERLS